MGITADLIVAGSLVLVWLAAGLLAEAVPRSGSARELHRRAVLLTGLTAVGAAVFVVAAAVSAWLPGGSAAAPAALVPAVPALVVLTVGLRRLGLVRRGAAAFATAPLTPVSPALRAAAAHPLILVPLQVTGLAALVAVPIAARLISVPGTVPAGSHPVGAIPATADLSASGNLPASGLALGGTDTAGIMITLVAIAVVTIGVRAALRHSRLSVLALAPIGRSRRRPPVGDR